MKPIFRNYFSLASDQLIRESFIVPSENARIGMLDPQVVLKNIPCLNESQKDGENIMIRRDRTGNNEDNSNEVNHPFQLRDE